MSCFLGSSITIIGGFLSFILVAMVYNKLQGVAVFSGYFHMDDLFFLSIPNWVPFWSKLGYFLATLVICVYWYQVNHVKAIQLNYWFFYRAYGSFLHGTTIKALLTSLFLTEYRTFNFLYDLFFIDHNLCFQRQTENQYSLLISFTA